MSKYVGCHYQIWGGMIRPESSGYLFTPELRHGIHATTAGESGKISRWLDSKDFSATSLEF
jgi:hypothetical protein